MAADAAAARRRCRGWRAARGARSIRTATPRRDVPVAARAPVRSWSRTRAGSRANRLTSRPSAPYSSTADVSRYVASSVCDHTRNARSVVGASRRPSSVTNSPSDGHRVDLLERAAAAARLQVFALARSACGPNSSATSRSLASVGEGVERRVHRERRHQQRDEEADQPRRSARRGGPCPRGAPSATAQAPSAARATSSGPSGTPVRHRPGRSRRGRAGDASRQPRRRRRAGAACAAGARRRDGSTDDAAAPQITAACSSTSAERRSRARVALERVQREVRADRAVVCETTLQEPLVRPDERSRRAAPAAA